MKNLVIRYGYTETFREEHIAVILEKPSSLQLWDIIDTIRSFLDDVKIKGVLHITEGLFSGIWSCNKIYGTYSIE
jgi:hypothetical protein